MFDISVDTLIDIVNNGNKYSEDELEFLITNIIILAKKYKKKFNKEFILSI